MRSYLLAGLGALCMGENIKVNFAACGATPEMDACTKELQGSTALLHLDDEALWPFTRWTDDALDGFLPSLLGHVCDTEAFQKLNVTCKSVVDVWTSAWTARNCPGEGLVDGWYDMAFGYVTRRRSASFDYSTMVTNAPKHSVVGVPPAGVITDTIMSAEGDGYTVVLNCGWGLNHLVRKLWHKATFAPCAEGLEAQMEAVAEAGWPTVGFIPFKADFSSANSSVEQIWTDIDMFTPFASQAQAYLAFFFNKRRGCLLNLVDEALSELRSTGQLQRLCGLYEITGLLECPAADIDLDSLLS